MAEPAHFELIHAEIDGELDAAARAELARRLLADPELRALRDDFQRLCARLDAMPQAEPPPDLVGRVLAALPHAARTPARLRWPAHAWRYAAMLAGVLIAGGVVFETARGPAPLPTEVSGTMTVAPGSAVVDSVRLPAGPLSGKVTLYRDGAGFGLSFDVAASAPVQVRVTGAGSTVFVEGAALQHGAGRQTTVRLPGLVSGQAVDVVFIMSGRQVGSATLRAPRGD